MNEIKPAFTIFTPTYNRAHTIHRVYEGLNNQTFQKFEWLIVDDGSTDGTAEMIEKWQQEARFPIRYYWQENQGKHIAHNVALEKAHGEFFLVLDSDDSIVPSALEWLYTSWISIPSEKRSDFCGAAALCVDQFGEIVGATLPSDVMDISLLEMRFIHKRSQEFITFYKTSIVREFPYPELPDAKFIPEGLAWSQIGQRYKTRYSNEALQIYYIDDDTENLMNRDPSLLGSSHSLWHRYTLNQEIDWFRYDPIYFLRSAVHYVRFSLHLGYGLSRQIKDLNNLLARLLWFFFLPIGIAVYLRDKNL